MTDTVVIINVPKNTVTKTKAKKEEKIVQNCCAWCAHDYNTPSVSIPIFSNMLSNYVINAFCTYNCAAAFNEYNSEFAQDKNRVYAELTRRYNESRGTHFQTLKLAPSRLTLKKFGGTLEIDKFRNVDVNDVYRTVLFHNDLICNTTELYSISNLDNTDCFANTINGFMAMSKIKCRSA